MSTANFELAEQIANALTNANTDHNEVAKASAYLNHIRNADDFFTWLQWMATPEVSQRLARSRQTPEYYKQIHRACQQLKKITDDKGKGDVNAMAQTLAWTVRLMRYYPVAKPVAPDRVLAQPQRPGPAHSQLTPTETGGPRLRLGDLRLGMELPGTVKRIADFGAFVDIGVGRDGLVHISRLREGYVGRVDEVAQPGQAVTVWVTEVDARQGRIGLTMVRPPRAVTTLPPNPALPVTKTSQPELPVRPTTGQVIAVASVQPKSWVEDTDQKSGREIVIAKESAMRQLRTILAQLYSEVADARRIGHDAGVAMERVALMGSALNMWDALLREAFHSQHLLALLTIVRDEYPSNPTLVTAVEAYKASTKFDEPTRVALSADTLTARRVSPAMTAAQQASPLRPAAIQVTSIEQIQAGIWVKGKVQKVEINRIVVEIGLSEPASLTFDHLPGQPSDPDEVAETWPAGTAIEAQVVSINKRGRVQLALK